MLNEGTKASLGRRDTRLGLSPLRDVVHVDDDAFDHRVVELVPRGNLAPAQRAVAMVNAHVGAQGSSGMRAQTTVAAVVAESCEILGFYDHIRVAPPDELVHRVARQDLDGFGREHDHSGRVDDDDRVGRVHEESPQAIFAPSERGRRDVLVARAHPDDAHHEDKSGGHQHRDPVTPVRANHARSPTEPDRDFGAGQTHETPHRGREHCRRTFDRDGLRRAEHETDREHRTPTGRVDHRGRTDYLQTDAQAEG